jgi:tetratricopeptide (TPR) repeat protein
LLAYLLDHPGELLSHDQLVEAVWDGRVVSDEAVRRAVSNLRSALGTDDARQIIKTVHGCGYIGNFPPLPADFAEEASQLPGSLSPGPITLEPQDSPSSASKGRKRSLAFHIKAWLLLAAGAILVEIIANQIASRFEEPQGGLQLPAENSLAVLPFDVCEEQRGDRVLAGGLTGAVYNRLAQREGLKIIGRTSSEAVTQSGVSPTAAAGFLGVRYLLNGVLCRHNNNLTLQTELTDYQGFTVWKQDFTQGVNPYDQVQTQLAVMVDNGVAAQLGDVAPAPTQPAVDRRALEQLLIGREYARQRDRAKAREALEKALELQPNYAEAKLEFAWLYDDFSDIRDKVGGYRQVYAHLEGALSLAKAQLHGNPRSSDANRVAGRILYGLAWLEEQLAWRDYAQIGEREAQARRALSERRYAESEQYYRIALAINPSDSQVRWRLAGAMARLGPVRRKEALDLLQQGLDLDPFNDGLAIYTALRQIEFGRHREAMELLDNFDALPRGKSPGMWWSQVEMLFNYGLVDEQLARLIDALQYQPELFFGNNPLMVHFWRLVGLIAGIGLTEEAEHLYELAAAIPRPESEDEQGWNNTRRDFLVFNYRYATGQFEDIAAERLHELKAMSNEDILAAWGPHMFTSIIALWHGGERERAIELMQGSRQLHSASPNWAERHLSETANLARMLMTAGRDEEARPLLQEIVEVLGSEVEVGVRHKETLGRLTEAYGWLGMREEALSTLELAIDYGFSGSGPGGVDYSFCCDDPAETTPPLGGERRWWNGLTEEPRFRRAAARLRSAREQQRSNTRSLLQMHDMDQLLLPLMNPSTLATR